MLNRLNATKHPSLGGGPSVKASNGKTIEKSEKSREMQDVRSKKE